MHNYKLMQSHVNKTSQNRYQHGIKNSDINYQPNVINFSHFSFIFPQKDMFLMPFSAVAESQHTTHGSQLHGKYTWFTADS